jgi:formylglycine-generating enzyme required for sulfatase activity
MIENRPLRVFLCHASKDNSVARDLYHQLDTEGWMDVWFIEARLLPSQNWEPEIMKGVKNADVVIVLLSKNFYTEEQTHYPNWNFVSNQLEASQDKKVLIIPLGLDDSNVPIQLKAWQAITYFPKRQRKSSYQKLLASLETYARQLDIALDKQLPPPVPEKGMQWTPSLWKQLDAEFEDEAESKPPNLRWSGVRQRFRKRLFSGVNNLFVWTAAIGTLLVVLICGLTINALVRGENTNSITAPIVSRALTLVPLPTPTLGVGSVRISPKDGMRMVYVPEGEFLMGSEDHQDDEKPVHKVYLDAYWIDQYEVTNGMYAKCVETKICDAPLPGQFVMSFSSSDPLYFGYWPENSEFFDQLATDPEFFNQPVMNIHWGNANAYCRWVNRRLPTEAEWEKAARSVDGRTYPWGETVDCTKANFFSCVDNPSRVGSFEAGQSPYGAYDMAGNALEWVADWYGRTYYQESPYENPLGPRTGLYRVFRGGSWGNEKAASRTTNRPGYVANLPMDYIGFRCASSE